MLSFIRAGGLLLASLFLLGGKGCEKTTTSKSIVDSRAAVAREDLLRKKAEATALNDQDKIAEHLEQLVVQYPDAPECKEWRLQLASTYLNVGSLEPAYRVYRDYTKLYPNDPNTEEAGYQAIFAKYKQTVKMRKECDVSEARKTIKLCEKYLSQPQNVVRRIETEDIKKTCENRIINKEIYIFDTYLAHGKTESAKSRLETLKEQHGTVNADLEPQLLYLECKLAKAEHRKNDAREICASLQSKFPESPFVKMAQTQAKASA